jgi:hypothetical protein
MLPTTRRALLWQADVLEAAKRRFRRRMVSVKVGDTGREARRQRLLAAGSIGFLPAGFARPPPATAVPLLPM